MTEVEAADTEYLAHQKENRKIEKRMPESMFYGTLLVLRDGTVGVLSGGVAGRRNAKMDVLSVVEGTVEENGKSLMAKTGTEHLFGWEEEAKQKVEHATPQDGLYEVLTKDILLS